MQEILESIARDIQAACIYIPYGIAATAVFLAIMILYNRQKYGNVSFVLKSILGIVYIVVVG